MPVAHAAEKAGRFRRLHSAGRRFAGDYALRDRGHSRWPAEGVHTVVPPASFCLESLVRTAIMRDALGLSFRSFSSLAADSGAPESGNAQAMKPISIVLSPTRSRPLNVFLGLLLMLVSLLLLLSIATWHASDPSLNTATGEVGPRAVHNWVGLFGAWLSDLLLQSIGIAAFFLPLWLGGLGWTWMHSRPSGSPWLRWTGTLLALIFLPAVFGLLPWHWRWFHLLPIEGVVGRLISALLVGYINIQGAWIVASILAATGLYFASAVSFAALKESLEERWIHVQAFLDRWRNWREERAERKAELESQRPADPGTEQEEADHRPSRFASFFRRRDRVQNMSQTPLEDIPAFQRAPVPSAEDEDQAGAPMRKSSIWERSVAQP